MPTSADEWRRYQSQMRGEDPALNPTQAPSGMSWEEYLARFGVGTGNVPLPRPRPGSPPPPPPLDPYAPQGLRIGNKRYGD